MAIEYSGKTTDNQWIAKQCPAYHSAAPLNNHAFLGIPAECGDCNNIDNGNGDAYEDTEIFDAILSETVENYRKPDIGVEPVTALGKGTGLKIGYFTKDDQDDAQAKHHGKGREHGKTETQIHPLGKTGSADLVEEHYRKKDMVYQPIAGLQKIPVGKTVSFQQTSHGKKDNHREQRVQYQHTPAPFQNNRFTGFLSRYTTQLYPKSRAPAMIGKVFWMCSML